MHDDSLPFGLRSHVRRERLVIALWGELDIYATERLTGRLAELTLTCCHDVILDLSGVTFLDCGGLSLLCQARAATRRRALRLTVVLEDPFHRKVLRLAGVAESFDVARSLSAALAVPPGDTHGHRPPAPSHA
ncbi:STAS domain-containing protein [Streptomyces sp. MNP-20]|uniref:STAS domain-containing protein n=1 Tax=Streptomyces sp. MNP-20 TaxID=2721165 RepID=UPI0015546E32|nr:STAS domain-containing protein [Streptomyces sp. MNP-20]